VDETSVSPRRLQEKAEAGYVAMQSCEMDIICASITSVSPRRLHEKAEAGHVAMQRREMKKRGWRRSDPVLSCSRWSWRCADSLRGCSSQLRRLMGLWMSSRSWPRRHRRRLSLSALLAPPLSSSSSSLHDSMR